MGVRLSFRVGSGVVYGFSLGFELDAFSVW